jgi:hypothetical protein
MYTWHLRRNIWSNCQTNPAALYDNTGAPIDRYP